MQRFGSGAVEPMFFCSVSIIVSLIFLIMLITFHYLACESLPNSTLMCDMEAGLTIDFCNLNTAVLFLFFFYIDKSLFSMFCFFIIHAKIKPTFHTPPLCFAVANKTSVLLILGLQTLVNNFKGETRTILSSVLGLFPPG